jgi:hypothetical protein
MFEVETADDLVEVFENGVLCQLCQQQGLDENGGNTHS